jgi:peptidoglycan/LPS O-acetylase OafA/YrhL
MRLVPNHTISYRPEIDGLRAIAVLSVILFHAGLKSVSGGFLGVDVFFVISGFLITSILVVELEQDRFSIIRFYERRARRILPALTLVILVCTPFAWFLLLPDQLKQSAEALVSVATFSSNFYFWRTTDYFAPPEGAQLLLHTWSLAVEEQYYLIFPIFLALFWRHGKKKVVTLIAVTAILSIFIAEWGRHHAPVANFYLLPSRAWELMFGAMLAIVPSKRLAWIHTRPVVANGLSLIGFGLTIGSIIAFDQNTAFPANYIFGPVLGSVLIIAAADRNTFVGKLLSSKPFVSVGLISYSAYLWHQPLLSMLHIVFQSDPPVGYRMLMISLSLILATLSYHFIEMPFRTKQKQLGSSKVLVLATGCLAVLIVAGTTVIASDGWPARMPPEYQKVNWREITEANDGLGKDCNFKTDFTPIDACIFGKDPRVVLWGDSFAMHLATGIKQAQISFIQATKSACGPTFYDAPTQYSGYYDESWARGCISFSSSVRKFLNDNKDHIKWVVISSPFDQFVEGAMFDGVRIREPTLDERVGTFVKTIADIREMGLRPLLVLPPPNAGKDIDIVQCMHRRAAGFAVMIDKLHDDCSFDEALSDQANKQRDDFVRRIVSESKVETLDLKTAMCVNGICASNINGIPLYRDAAHLSKPGAALLEEQHGLWKKRIGE